MPANLAHAARIKGQVVVGSSRVINGTVVDILSMGFRDSDGELIPNVKVVWYIWNSSIPPIPPLSQPVSIANLVLITHTGNYSIEYRGASLVLIDVVSVDTRTNSTGWATLNYVDVNPCFYFYEVWGTHYSAISHLSTSGSC